MLIIVPRSTPTFGGSVEAQWPRQRFAVAFCRYPSGVPVRFYCYEHNFALINGISKHVVLLFSCIIVVLMGWMDWPAAYLGSPRPSSAAADPTNPPRSCLVSLAQLSFCIHLTLLSDFCLSCFSCPDVSNSAGICSLLSLGESRGRIRANSSWMAHVSSLFSVIHAVALNAVSVDAIFVPGTMALRIILLVLCAPVHERVI